MTNRRSHLVWIPLGAAVSFLTSFLFGDLLLLPVDLYYLIYFAVVIGFLAFYVVQTELPLRAWLAKRWKWGVVLGIFVGVVMMQNVLSRPETDRFTGAALAGAVLWRGVVYGAVDGVLLYAFPWIVVWRAFHAEERSLGVKVRAAMLSWLAILFITTTYHLGYADFRSEKIVQPNVGSAIMAVPTLAAASPIASPITHVFLHVAAVVHSPRTDLFLPPHREHVENAHALHRAGLRADVLPVDRSRIGVSAMLWYRVVRCTSVDGDKRRPGPWKDCRSAEQEELDEPYRRAE